MPAEVRNTQRFAQAASRLEELCEFDGSQRAFWTACLALLAEVSGAKVALLLQGEPEWKAALAWPANLLGEENARPFLEAALALSAPCFAQGAVSQLWHEGAWLLALRLQGEQEEKWVAVFCVTAAAEEAMDRLRLLAHVPALYRLRLEVSRSEIAVSHFASVLDLGAQLNAHRRFLAVAMTFCNELAARHQCDRASLGWLSGEYVRLRAISHTERFEKRMEAVQMLEAAMEESLDQDETLVWPATEDQQLVVRDHARFAEEQKVKFLCSLPLRLDGEPVAVLTCERNSAPFAEVEVRLLALCGEMAIRRLVDLEKHDRWFGARWLAAGRERLGKLLGPQHTGAKCIALASVLVFGWLLFGHVQHRVDAPFSLRTEQTAFVTAPFNSYLDEVQAEAGAEVKKGDTLAQLDTRELVTEEGGALADRDRFLREAEKAKAAEKLADMRIADAQAEQARSRLEIVRQRRAQAKIVAPFDGVVVEGDLKKRIGSPVRQGDVLFRVARTDQFFIECLLAESDVPELRVGGTGEVAFASMPKQKFPVRIQMIEPAAHAKEGMNVITVRCQILGNVEAWWRPGMSGVAQLDVGRRSPGWALTQRTVDYLRLHLWW